MLPVHDLDMPAEERRFLALGGRVSLDLVATIGERWRRRFERLRTPADLDRWLEFRDLPSSDLTTVLDLEAMRRLRGAVELLAVSAVAREPYPTLSVDIVNDFADAPPLSCRLSDGRHATPAGSHAQLRSTIARDAIEVFGTPHAERVRECAADDCALMFLDTSRPGSRRWCSMRACGNRVKVARHRASAD